MTWAQPRRTHTSARSLDKPSRPQHQHPGSCLRKPAPTSPRSSSSGVDTAARVSAAHTWATDETETCRRPIRLDGDKTQLGKSRTRRRQVGRLGPRSTAPETCHPDRAALGPRRMDGRVGSKTAGQKRGFCFSAVHWPWLTGVAGPLLLVSRVEVCLASSSRVWEVW